MAQPQKKTTDLSQQVPPDFTLGGFSAVQSDGVNPFRTPQHTSEVRLSTAGPRYLRFEYQLYSPSHDVQAQVWLDGQALGAFTFPAGQFVTVFPSGFVNAGAHVLRFEQRCAVACDIRQYHPKLQQVSVEAASRPVGFEVQRWWLNAPDTAVKLQGLSGIQFDGSNYFRLLTTSQPATFTLPAGVRVTNLHYLTQSDHGSYRLHWKADGQALPPARIDPAATVLKAGENAEQNLPLVGRDIPKQLTVQAECVGSGACLPLRFFFIELTGVPTENGFTSLSQPLQLGAVGLGLALAVVFAALLRPGKGASRARN